MGPPSYMQSVVDRNVIMRRIAVRLFGMYRSSVHNNYRTAVSIMRLYQLHISYRYRLAYTWTDIGRL